MSDVKIYFVDPSTLIEKAPIKSDSITLKGGHGTTYKRKITTYGIPQIPDDEYRDRFVITADPVVDVEPNPSTGWYPKHKERYEVVCMNEVVLRTVCDTFVCKDKIMYTTYNYDKAIAKRKEIEKCGLKAFIRTVDTKNTLSRREQSFFFDNDFMTQLHKIDSVTNTYTCMCHTLDESGEHKEVTDMNLHELNNYLAKLIYEPNLIKVVNEVRNFQITNKKSHRGTSAVTDYCVIDHVNSINNKVLINACYKEANRIAKSYKIEDKRIYKMKEFCNRTASHSNWDKRDGGFGYKMRVRHRYNPKLVVLICEDIKNLSAKQAYNAWADHGVEVRVVQANTFANERQFYTTDSVKRNTVAKWSSACDWSLSAPLYRDIRENSLETYCKRSDADYLREAGELHITKTNSRPESFLEQQRVVTPKDEVNRMHNTAFACRQFAINNPHSTDKVFWTTDGFDVEEFFDLDKVICPHCGEAMNPHNHKDANQRETEFIICTHCETKFPEDMFEVFDCKPYYEDNGDDNDSDYDA